MKLKDWTKDKPKKETLTEDELDNLINMHEELTTYDCNISSFSCDGNSHNNRPVMRNRW